MMPSTFFQQKYDNATLARKLKAKQELAKFWQQVVGERTNQIYLSDSHKFGDKAAELHVFQEKLMEGKEFPSLREILRFHKLYEEEFDIRKMSHAQLSALSKMLGLPQSKFWWPAHLEVQLRHHVTNLRREDRDYLWEGIDSLTQGELIEACRKRGIRFHDVTEAEMRQGLTRWLELSANHRSIPTTLLLWIQSFYLTVPGSTEGGGLKLEVQVVQPQEVEAKEAFSRLAQRQKAFLESAKSRLEILRQEIDQVLERRDEVRADKESTKQSEQSVKAEDAPESRERRYGGVQVEKQQLLRRMHDLNESLRLYQEVVGRQKCLLDQQLQFLLNMRDNKPSQNKDADVILLDQRVRLMEMIGDFKKFTEEIEALLSDVPAKDAVQQSIQPLGKPAGPQGQSGS